MAAVNAVYALSSNTIRNRPLLQTAVEQSTCLQLASQGTCPEP